MDDLSFEAFLGVSSTAGLLGNLFIVFCIVLPWGEEDKKRGGQNVHLTIGCVAGANAFICFFSVAHMFLKWYINFSMTISFLYLLVVFFLLTSYQSTIWFTALLFLLYCVKILPAQNIFFQKVKTMISKMVHWGIGAAFFSCFGLNSIFIFSIFGQNGTHNEHNSTTTDCYGNIMNMIILIIFSVFYVILPLSLMNLSSISISFFLCRHIYKVNTDVLQNPRLERQKQIIFMLFFQMLAYTGLVFCILPMFFFCQLNISQEASDFLSIAGPPMYALLTSVNLIFRNGFLRWKVKLLIGLVGRHVWR